MYVKLLLPEICKASFSSLSNLEHFSLRIA